MTLDLRSLGFGKLYLIIMLKLFFKKKKHLESHLSFLIIVPSILKFSCEFLQISLIISVNARRGLFLFCVHLKIIFYLFFNSLGEGGFLKVSEPHVKHFSIPNERLVSPP